MAARKRSKKHGVSSAKTETQATPAMSSINPNEDYAHTLKLLTNMGFTDLDECRRAANAANGVLPLSVEYLTNGIPEPKRNTTQGGSRSNSTTVRQSSVPANPSSSQAPATRWTFPRLTQAQADKVLQCAAMGFTDEGKIRHALSTANWSAEDAVELLLKDENLSSSFSSFEASSRSNLVSSALAGSKSNLSHVITASASNSPRNSLTAGGIPVLPINHTQPNHTFHTNQVSSLPGPMASHVHNNSPHNPFGGGGGGSLGHGSRSGSQSNISYDAFANAAAAKTVSVFDRPPETNLIR